MVREYTAEDIINRKQHYRIFLEGINFRIPEKSDLALDIFKNQCVTIYAESRVYSDPEAFTPSKARIERILHDTRALASDPRALIGKPKSFAGKSALWKHRLRNQYRVDGQKVIVKSGEVWKECTPLEECFALFAECHMTSGGLHNGRLSTYEGISAEGTRTGLPQYFVMKLIDCCDVCKIRTLISKKRGREVDGGGGGSPSSFVASTPVISSLSGDETFLHQQKNTHFKTQDSDVFFGAEEASFF